MAKNKSMFSSLNDCNTKNIYVGDERSLSVVGTRTIHPDNGQCNDVLCVLGMESPPTAGFWGSKPKFWSKVLKDSANYGCEVQSRGQVIGLSTLR